MLPVLFGILGLLAVGAWGVAVVNALNIVGLAPAGQRLSTWFQIGWWRFDKVRAVAGAGADPFIKRYIQAFVAFFAAILVAMALGILLTFTAQNRTGEDEATDSAYVTGLREIAITRAGAAFTPRTRPDIHVSISGATTPEVESNHRAGDAAA